ncbi:MAG TPA: GntR family transcriptional regulator, partial [Candidatus Binatia bacterium]
MILGRGSGRAEKRFKSLTKLLFEELKEAIVAGKLAPGERLFEAKLAASLKVGPVAIREALRALETEGYVTFRPDNEVVVSKPTRDEIEDYYTISGALEGLAARLA